MQHIIILGIFFLFLFNSCTSNNPNKGKEEEHFYSWLSNPQLSIDSLQFILKHSKNDSLKIEVHNKLFFAHVYHDVAAAQIQIDSLINLGSKYPYAMARAYNAQGINLDISGHFDEAIKKYQEAIRISTNRYPNIEASINNNLGLIYWNRGNYLDAITCYKKALHLFEQTNNTKFVANVHSNMGLIYKDINDTQLSNHHLEQALKLRKELNDEYGISVSLTNLSIAYLSQNNLSKAIQLLDSSIALKTKLQDEIGLSNTLYWKANAYYELDSIDAALLCLNEALKLCLKNNSFSNNLINIYVSLGDIYLKQKNYNEIYKLLPQLKSILDKTKDERNLINYYSLYGNYYKAKGDYYNALQMYQLSDSLYQIVEGTEVKNAIHLYETQYKTAQKDAALIQAQLKIADQTILDKQKNIWMLLLVSFIILCLFLLYSLRTKAKNKQKQMALENEILQEQNYIKLQEQRLDISRNLHDSIGAQLTFIQSIADSLKNSKDIPNTMYNEKLKQLSQHSENAILELRNTLWILHAESITLNDLKSKLLNFINQAAETFEHIEFNFQFDVLEEKKISSKFAIHVLSIVQELVNNAIKYANASQINITLTELSNTLSIQVNDNGIGFDVDSMQHKSYGLSNIQNRVKLMEGTLTINAQPQEGAMYLIQSNLDL